MKLALLGSMGLRPARKWALADHPRQRLLSLGAGGLTDAELVALVLGNCSRQPGDMMQTSRALLARFGGLQGVVRSHPSALMRLSGIGEARACALAAVLELARRLESNSLPQRAALKTSAEVFALVRSRLSLLEQEVFLALSLNARHRPLALHQVAQGTATSVEVHPREVFALAVRDAAAAVIVAHNHPSGDPEPSFEDRQLTRRLVQAGEIMSIPLLDHLVVGAKSYVSLADRGLI